MNERGSALLIVVWVVLLACAMVLAIGYQLELETVLSEEFRNERQARADAESIFWWAVLRLQNDTDELDTLKEFTFEASAWEADIGALPGELALIDEGSRVNVNTTSAELLGELFKELQIQTKAQVEGEDEEQAEGQNGEQDQGQEQVQEQEFLDLLLDWRDFDDQVRPNGAEEAEYSGMSPPVKIRNGSLPVPQELCRIKDGEKHWEMLKDHVTVWGPANLSMMDGDVFINLLQQAGEEIDETTVVMTKQSFDRLKKDNQIKKLDDLKKAYASIDIELLNKLKELISAEGVYNPNFLSKESLRALLKHLKIELSEELLNSEMLFDSREAFENFLLGSGISTEKIWSIFTLQSKLWRIRVTIKRGSRRLILDAIVRREREGEGQRWKASILRFNETWQTIPKEEEHEALEDGAEPK